jgi:hypothetical protein
MEMRTSSLLFASESFADCLILMVVPRGAAADAAAANSCVTEWISEAGKRRASSLPQPLKSSATLQYLSTLGWKYILSSVRDEFASGETRSRFTVP